METDPIHLREKAAPHPKAERGKNYESEECQVIPRPAFETPRSGKYDRT